MTNVLGIRYGSEIRTKSENTTGFGTKDGEVIEAGVELEQWNKSSGQCEALVSTDIQLDICWSFPLDVKEQLIEAFVLSKKPLSQFPPRTSDPRPTCQEKEVIHY
ncbi:uncharacterized protein BDCG_04866 [Blastomyces dermatitidis ER-3]|nr:uncharacterized protein BDCG_04866 [Blastomyces dermatitidis ER-3]EGE85976.1 hypothetical protein BDDG_08921 [Blastomyces dermatitidis ATCC 18188]EQL27959.1 hypothetical protein BDFG_09247 [Blastomyces dermatitidis ATCC 26199]OAT01311.1 hypothetical protein BDCG_04866 [Blastomyces dermatitidis ER-3]